MKDDKKFEFWKRHIYPWHWLRVSKKYPLDSYCKGLIKIVEELSPKSCFELGIGTGYPFAKSFSDKGISISGCDISPMLLEEAKRICPSLAVCEGGYEDLEKVGSVFGKKFDLVYCFRSTLHFLNITQAIDFMLFFVKPGGAVVFDILNADSAYNKQLVRKKKMTFTIILFKNAVKKVINIFSPNKYILERVFGTNEIMYKPDEIKKILVSKNLQVKIFTLRDVSIKGGEVDIDSSEFDQKMVFVVSC